MPTGYTAILMDRGQTFQEFIMGCARAFGALIEMRDSPNDAPIPDTFEPSDYHAKKLIESREALAKLKAMTEAERGVFGQAEKAAAVQRLERWLEKDREQNARLEDMALQVQAWSPPTGDHQGLKDFMLRQISISKNNIDYIHDRLATATERPATAYHVAAVSEAACSIKYHAEEYTKECERANSRMEWVRQLKASI